MELFKKNLQNKKPEIPQSREYKKLKKIKIVNLFSIIVFLATIVSTSYFVYNNVYKTLGELDAIAIVNNLKNFEAVNFKNYDDAILAWENKNQENQTLQVPRDLFNKTLTIATSTPDEILEGTVETTN